jgi:predicted nucleic acid-binding protein
VNKVLLDTDIDSEVLKAIDPTVAQNAATYRQQHGFLTLSAVTLMEIVRGYQRKRSARRLQAFLSAVALEEVLDFDRSAVELAGRIVGELEYVGRPIGNADSMIAAIALEHGLELATGNTSHFQRVHHLGYPLTLVNWRV